MEATPLIVELAVALVAATIGAVVAVRLGVSPIVGYIVAGIAIGPYTPGLAGDAEVVRSVADIGVVFLMFAIGAQVSLPDLARVGRLASIGGVVQTLVLLGAGYAVGRAIGLTPLEALFLGAVASNSSSMVLGKILGDRGETETEHGRTGLAWSTVQDLGTIVIIIVLGALATSPGTIAEQLSLGLTMPSCSARWAGPLPPYQPWANSTIRARSADAVRR
jgi:CPA2 family monovalent cation:H+ antiporter-2